MLHLTFFIVFLQIVLYLENSFCTKSKTKNHYINKSILYGLDNFFSFFISILNFTE